MKNLVEYQNVEMSLEVWKRIAIAIVNGRFYWKNNENEYEWNNSDKLNKSKKFELLQNLLQTNEYWSFGKVEIIEEVNTFLNKRIIKWKSNKNDSKVNEIVIMYYDEEIEKEYNK